MLYFLPVSILGFGIRAFIPSPPHSLMQKSDLHTAFVSISLQGLCDSAPHLGYLSNICPQLLTPVSVHSALASSASITHPVIIGCRTQPSLTSIPSPAACVTVRHTLAT